MELWNDKTLARPPNNAVKTRILSKDVLKLRDILKHALNILESKKFLDREAAVLSRFLFIHKRRFRHHTGSKFMNKVHRGLKRFFQMDVKDIFINFEKSLSYAVDDADVNNSKYLELYIPTRQLLDYVLIRIQGFAKLMQYLTAACENAAYYFRSIISHGHLIKLFTLGFCIVSRIWYFSNYYVSCACTWYKELVAFREIIKPLGAVWLPGDYKFPHNLSRWLGRNALTGKFWASDIDVTIGSAGLPLEKPPSNDLGVVISRDAFEAASSLKLTTSYKRTLKTVNKYIKKQGLGFENKKRKKGNKTDGHGSQKKKIKKDNISDNNMSHGGNDKKKKMENDKKKKMENDEEKESCELKEDSGVRNKVIPPTGLNFSSLLTAATPKSEEPSVAKKTKEVNEQRRRKKEKESKKVSIVVGHRIKNKIRKRVP